MMGCPTLHAWGEIAKIASPVVSWALVIGGWHWIRQDQNARERRKELRVAITEICKQVGEVERDAHAYIAETSAGTPESRSSETRIKALLHRLDGALERLRADEAIDVQREFLQYKQAITLKDFERAERKKAEPPTWPLEISQAASVLIDACERRFRGRHP